MSLGVRITERLKALDISQSELARRAKIPQTTVNSLVKAGRRTTPHLLKLARALKTTPEYLTGESDDPASGATIGEVHSSDVSELADLVEHLAPADRKALLQIARSMAGGAHPSETVHAGGVNPDAAARDGRDADQAGERS